MKILNLLLLCAGLLLLAACEPEEEAPSIIVSLVADGVERAYSYPYPVTVGEFLADAEVECEPPDRINPPLYTQISDGIRVTCVRVSERVDCEQQEIPYEVETIPNEALVPGDEFLGRAGVNGVEEICYSVRIEDGVELDPREISRTIITESQNEVVYVGPTGELDPVAISGTLAYISNGNAWVMRDSSATRRPLTNTNDLDRRVFSLTPDGRQLLFTRDVSAGAALDNQLWLISDTTLENSAPVQLIPTNILYAEWVPQATNSISYSTAEGRETTPGWQAQNDLWTMRIDPQTGSAVNVDPLVDPSCRDLYCWWGMNFAWSPDGTAVACVNANSVGIVDLEARACVPLVEYPLYETSGDWSWRATVSWSPDSTLIMTTIHGDPVGIERPETSPAFHLAVTDTLNDFEAEIVQNAGIWSSPRYSPLIYPDDSGFPQGYIAYLSARDWDNSINAVAEYDLVVADRDGSNPHLVFPETGRTGLTARGFATDFTWSPDGTQIALIYQGNLWVVDIESGTSHQLTLDGAASKPIWTQ